MIYQKIIFRGSLFLLISLNLSFNYPKTCIDCLFQNCSLPLQVPFYINVKTIIHPKRKMGALSFLSWLIISLSYVWKLYLQGLVKRETRFTSQRPPNEIMSKIEEAAKPLGFNVRKGNYKVDLSIVLGAPVDFLCFAIGCHLYNSSFPDLISWFIWTRWSYKVIKLEGKASSL